MEFEEEYSAIEFARLNSSPYREYQVINLDENEIVDSDKMAQEEIDASADDMFPEGQDE